MRLIALAFVLATGTAGAQQFYRCGSTFSQQPCGPDAKVVPSAGVAQPAAPVTPEKRAAIEADCRTWITRVPAWKDRDSLKIGPISRGDTQTRDGRVVRAYYSLVNGKNAMGGYAGERPFVCLADEAAAQVVALVQPGEKSGEK